MIKVSKIQSCRICNNQNLERIILLPKMPFTDEFVNHKNLGNEFLSDIEIGICIFNYVIGLKNVWPSFSRIVYIVITSF